MTGGQGQSISGDWCYRASFSQDISEVIQAVDVLGSSIGAGHSRYYCGRGGYRCQALAEANDPGKGCAQFLEGLVIHRSPHTKKGNEKFTLFSDHKGSLLRALFL